jgi:hypothetical protein
MLEIGLIAAMLMQRFHLHWPQGAAWPAVDLALSLRPAKAMVLNLALRATPGLASPQDRQQIAGRTASKTSTSGTS